MKKIILMVLFILSLGMAKAQNTPVLSTLSPTSFSVSTVASKNIMNPLKVTAGYYNNDTITDFAVSTENDTLTFVAGKTSNTYTNTNRYAIPGLKDFNVYSTINGTNTPAVIVSTPLNKNTTFNFYLLGSGTGTLPATPGAINLTTTPAYSGIFPFRGCTGFSFGQIDNATFYDLAFVGQEGLATVTGGTGTYTNVTKYSNLSNLSRVSVFNATSGAGDEVMVAGTSGNTVGYFAAQTFVKELTTNDFSGVTSIHSFIVNDTATVTRKVGVMTAGSTIKTYSVSGATILNDSTYLSGSTPVRVAIGDMDGDHKVDLISAELDGNIRIYKGRSNNTAKFQLAGTYFINEPVLSIAVGDFNNDGKLDIVYVGVKTKKVYILTQS